MKNVILVMAGIVVISIGVLGFNADATTNRKAQETEATQLLESIDRSLSDVRNIRQQGELTYTDVMDRLDVMEDIGESIKRLKTQYAHTSVVSSASAELIMERHQSNSRRLQKMRDRLSR